MLKVEELTEQRRCNACTNEAKLIIKAGKDNYFTTLAVCKECATKLYKELERR